MQLLNIRRKIEFGNIAENNVFILQVINIIVLFAFTINLLFKKCTGRESVIEKNEKDVSPQDQFIVSGKEA